MATEDHYISKMKLQLDALNLRWGMLEARVQEVGEDLRDQYKAEMARNAGQPRVGPEQLGGLEGPIG